VLDDLGKHAVWGRQSTDPDGRSTFLALRDSMENFPELIWGKRQNNFIIWAGRNLTNWYSYNLADNLRINYNNMPRNDRWRTIPSSSFCTTSRLASLIT
jgi:hypothetical protein